MPIEKKPFRKYRLDEELEKKDKTFTTRLTEKDREWFLPAKKFIKQPKNSTAMKQLANIGAVVVLHDKKINKILDVVMNNNRRNKRLGIPESEYEKL